MRSRNDLTREIFRLARAKRLRGAATSASAAPGGGPPPCADTPRAFDFFSAFVGALLALCAAAELALIAWQIAS